MGRSKRKKDLRITATDAVGFPSRQDITLPERVAQHFGRLYPGVWKTVEAVRQSPGMCGLTGWQPWCYLPINVASGILIHHTEDDYSSARQAEVTLHHHTRMLAALSAWRMTKGVFSFDPAVLREMVDSDVRDGLPEECFLRLPEWCVYIPTPGINYMPGVPLHGFFAYVDDHGVGGRNAPPELNLEMLIDPRGGPAALRELLPGSAQYADNCAHMHVCVDLSTGSFARAMGSMADALVRKAETVTNNSGLEDDGRFSRLASMTEQQREEMLAPMVERALKLANLVLYLCADEADIRPEGLGNRRVAVKSSEKSGKRSYMAPAIMDWQVGYRIGAELRLGQWQHARGEPGEGHGSPPRPHIRRAHWHSYWTGPRTGPQERRVKWLLPIPVNVESLEMLMPNLRSVADTRLPPGQQLPR